MKGEVHAFKLIELTDQPGQVKVWIEFGHYCVQNQNLYFNDAATVMMERLQFNRVYLYSIQEVEESTNFVTWVKRR